MKKIYIFLPLMIVFQSTYPENNEIDCVDDDEIIIEGEGDLEVDRAIMRTAENEYIDHLLDRMIEGGAIQAEIQVKPLPWWKRTLFSIGDVLFARYVAIKKFMYRRYVAIKKTWQSCWKKRKNVRRSQYYGT